MREDLSKSLMLRLLLLLQTASIACRKRKRESEREMMPIVYKFTSQNKNSCKKERNMLWIVYENERRSSHREADLIEIRCVFIICLHRYSCRKSIFRLSPPHNAPRTLRLFRSLIHSLSRFGLTQKKKNNKKHGRMLCTSWSEYNSECRSNARNHFNQPVQITMGFFKCLCSFFYRLLLCLFVCVCLIPYFLSSAHIMLCLFFYFEHFEL